MHEANELALIYVDRYSTELITRLQALRKERQSVFVYAWAPGQITPLLAGLDIEVTPVRDALVKRFQQ